MRYELPGRVRCDRLCEFLTRQKTDVREAHGREALRKFLEGTIPEADKFVEDLTDFVQIEPELPGVDKNFTGTGVIQLSVEQSRDQIIEYLRQARVRNVVADLAFHAYRDMGSCDWRPFVKGAVERSPVSLEKTNSMSIEEVCEWLNHMPGESIYDENRLAQPDELANYGTGDGLEKAFLLANVLRHRNPELSLHLEVDNSSVVLRAARESVAGILPAIRGRDACDTYEFVSTKSLQGQVDIKPEGGIAAAGRAGLTKRY
jgi:hypothetical protein